MMAPGLRVLLADDDPTVSLLARAVLAAPEFVLTVVGDGAAALRVLEAESFDLVLLDVEMPVMDGLQAAQQIRRRYGMALPIVLATGREDAVFVERLAELGAGYLPKPIDWGRLPILVRAWAAP